MIPNKNLYYILYFFRTLIGQKKTLLAGIKLSHHCNLTCDHCPFWKKTGGSLTFEQTVSAMNSLHALGVRIVIFEGGEPFLWRDRTYTLKDLVAEAKKLFFSVCITTNGTLPIDTSSDIVWVSIDGLRETHNRLRCNSFDNVLQNIAASVHPKIFAHITINLANYEQIPELIRFLADKVKGITIQFHYPYQEGERDLSLTPEQRVSVLDTLISLKKQGLPVSNSVTCLKALKYNTWKCRPWMIASVDPDGTITQGCYVKNRGVVACDKCGFSAHAEISLAYGGSIDAILLSNKIF